MEGLAAGLSQCPLGSGQPQFHPHCCSKSCWRGSLQSQLFFLPDARPGNTLWFSFFQVKVFEAKGAIEMFPPVPGALGRTLSPADPAAERLYVVSPAPWGLAQSTPRGHSAGPQRGLWLSKAPPRCWGRGRVSAAGMAVGQGGPWGPGEGRTGNQRGEPRAARPGAGPGDGTHRGHALPTRGRDRFLEGEAHSGPPLPYSPPARRPRVPPLLGRRRTARRYHRDPGRHRHVTTPPGSHRASHNGTRRPRAAWRGSSRYGGAEPRRPVGGHGPGRPLRKRWSL